MSKVMEARASAPSRFAIRFIEVYQGHVGTKSGYRCPFEPSCSEYALQAYQRFGFFKATRKAIGRLSRCRDGYKGSRMDPL
jgi:hypothetical protein